MENGSAVEVSLPWLFPYLIIFVFDLDMIKCTIYVIIVTLKYSRFVKLTINVLVHNSICDCITYQIPGYYIGFTPGKEAIAEKFTLLDHGMKGLMYILLFGTDIIIIMKLYQTRALGKNRRRPTDIQLVTANHHTNNTAKITALVTLPPIPRKHLRLKVTLDIRLAVAFLYIAIVNSLLTMYVVCIASIPPEAILYLNVLIYDLDLSKCTIYVLIVALK
ncbi:unnamed protein product, partial [Mesorhabditis spiculigera]